jgi:hypothetical protein
LRILLGDPGKTRANDEDEDEQECRVMCDFCWPHKNISASIRCRFAPDIKYMQPSFT